MRKGQWSIGQVRTVSARQGFCHLREEGDFIKEWLRRSLADHHHRIAASSLAAAIANALIGIGKLTLGVYLVSDWFMANGVYYLLLCAAKVQTLQRFAAVQSIEDPKQRYAAEFSVYKRGGLFLCLLGISYLFICLRMYIAKDAVVYKGYIVYLVAAAAFTKLGFAVYGIAVNRRSKGPLMATLRIISFTDAMVSIVMTQFALLTMEGSANALNSSALFGMSCSIFFVLLGIYMLLNKKTSPSPGEDLPNLNAENRPAGPQTGAGAQRSE